MAKPKPVTIGKDTYPSKHACARAVGVSVRAVSKAIQNGTLDTLGLGNKVSIQIGEKVYESLAEAGRATGKSRQAIWAKLNRELGGF